MRESKLNTVVNYLNKHFHQDSEEYSIFYGAKPQVIRISEHCAVSLWSCGAIACIHHLIYFISEDDGHWFVNDYVRHDDAVYNNRFSRSVPDYDIENGLQGSFSISWLDSYMDALKSLNEYVKENGKPVYFSGIRGENGEKIQCGYTL